MLIVIDGTDGAGKKTQTALLIERLKKGNYPVETVQFPQYNVKSTGLVEEYLSGKYGSAEEVGPYRASIFYACDRYDASFKMKKWISGGKVVVADRYVTSNMGHQGSKIADNDELKKYFEWNYNLEYNIFGLPKPDLNIILHVPTEIAFRLIQERTRDDWNGKTKDIHEEDYNHLKKAERTYLQMAAMFPNLKIIECVKNDKLISREEISDLVWAEVRKVL
ncbi:MAG: deoxynucleoside kinase [bacterium]